MRLHTLITSTVFVAVVFLVACQPATTPVARTVPASGMAPVNDIQMYYEIHGDGTPLILLHGGLGSTVNWRNQIPVLSKQYKVIAVDSRGHGRSIFTERRISYTLMASDIVALMDYLGIEKAHILGWSDGGIIGLDLAINHPDRLNKVIAFGANYNPSGMRADIGENEKINDFIENAAKEYQTLSPDPTRWDAFLENIGQMWASEPNFTAEQLGSITIPMLILDGDNDEAIYTEHTKELAGLIPTAKLTFIPGTGHFAMWEKPDEINKVILEFLASATLPQWAYDSTMIFPRDRSLTRPEDGIALPDGRLIVADQVHGLRRVELEGTSAPFGDLVAAGYVHRPPDQSGGSNGISLEPGGTHLLVTDIFHGGIYRVDVATGATQRVYQHRYGVNTAVRDSRGAIWFTQSAHNTPEAGEARIWATVDIPRPEGALLRLGMQGGRFAREAEVLLDSLYFANGMAIDEASGHLYLSEMMGGRVLRYRVDLDVGRVSERSVFVDSVAVDNLELDGEGNLWAVLPLTNEVLVVNTATGAPHTAFRSVTPAQQEVVQEFIRRGQSGTSRMELFTPAVWAPLPGPITGVIVSPGGGPVYLTGLGDALVRLTR